MYYGVVYHSYEELKRAIEEYIKYYNEKRIKGKLGWVSPVDYRELHAVAWQLSYIKNFIQELLRFYPW